MIDRQQIKTALLARKEQSAACARQICDRTYRGQEEFSLLFRRYLCGKFMLELEDLDTDDFYQICQYSVEKASHYPPGSIDAAEFASKCGGATTATNKKVLFIMALRRELQVPITAEEAIGVDLLSQLIAMSYQKLEA